MGRGSGAGVKGNGFFFPMIFYARFWLIQHLGDTLEKIDWDRSGCICKVTGLPSSSTQCARIVKADKAKMPVGERYRLTAADCGLRQASVCRDVHAMKGLEVMRALASSDCIIRRAPHWQQPERSRAVRCLPDSRSPIARPMQRSISATAGDPSRLRRRRRLLAGTHVAATWRCAGPDCRRYWHSRTHARL